MIKVINLSLGRTGTLSLKQALEELGFAKCYHFSEIYDNPEHIPIWLSVGRKEKIDWEKLFAGYQSTVYWTPSYDYMTLLKDYPDIKVILTVRDPERWYQSVYDTIYKNSLTMPRRLLLRGLGLFKPELKDIYAVWRLQEQTLWQKTFKGKFHDKKFAIAVFTQYIEEVKRNVPADRLLVFNVKEGWMPLCRFLAVPVPETPFPRVNDSASFIGWRKGLFKIAVIPAQVSNN